MVKYKAVQQDSCGCGVFTFYILRCGVRGTWYHVSTVTARNIDEAIHKFTHNEAPREKEFYV